MLTNGSPTRPISRKRNSGKCLALPNLVLSHINFSNKPPSSYDDDDDDGGNDFESELAAMELDEATAGGSTAGEIATGLGPENQQTSVKWSRPDPPVELNDPETAALIFQQLDIDHYIGQPMAGMPGSQLGAVPVMRMFGVTMAGNSVCCHVHGFTPYMYMATPRGFAEADCAPFKYALNRSVLNDMRSNKEQVHEAILEVQILERLSLVGYAGDELQQFIRITVALPRLLAAVKRLLERERVYDKFDFQDCRAYENNIDFDIRFMVDAAVVGCSWIELPPGTWRRRHRGSQPPPESRCQLEVDVAWDAFVAHEPEGKWAAVAPFRVLSFDIECAGRKGIFPEATHDPVIQIANMCIRQGEPEPFLRNVFTLNTCAPIVGSQVLSHQREAEMLEAWSSFVREVDPDILTGYNINNFDVPYLLNRASHLKVKNFEYLGRIKNIR